MPNFHYLELRLAVKINYLTCGLSQIFYFLLRFAWSVTKGGRVAIWKTEVTPRLLRGSHLPKEVVPVSIGGGRGSFSIHTFGNHGGSLERPKSGDLFRLALQGEWGEGVKGQTHRPPWLLIEATDQNLGLKWKLLTRPFIWCILKSVLGNFLMWKKLLFDFSSSKNSVFRVFLWKGTHELLQKPI